MPDGRITRRRLIILSFLGLTGMGKTNVDVFAPRVWFVEPPNNALVTSPVRVVFGLQGYVVRPAGDNTANTGHHHLIIDGAYGAPFPYGVKIPFDEPGGIFHYGEGQVEAFVPLSPGPHTLTAQFANGEHKAYGSLQTATIQVEVVP